MSIIDYSQYSLWNFCPWAWYERMVNMRQLRRVGQRSDPLCLGSVVHNGLDNFAKYGKPFFDEETLADNAPTKETVELAELLVQGYLRKYPNEIWPVERSEQPLQFPLWNPSYSVPKEKVLNGLAKLDGMFYVPEDTTIESGLPGDTITLARGWWGKEYKTKNHGRKRSEWIKEWQTKRQADFQMLALTEQVLSQPRHHGDDVTVQGIMVCVLEKPHEYTPMRKCAACKDSFELASFIPTSEGFNCPMCGVTQSLTPYIPKVPKIPEYFRITVTRTPDQLETARREILATGLEMEAARVNGMDSLRPNRDACVNNVHRHECEYIGPHTYGGTTETSGAFVQLDTHKYMGVTV